MRKKSEREILDGAFLVSSRLYMYDICLRCLSHPLKVYLFYARKSFGI